MAAIDDAKERKLFWLGLSKKWKMTHWVVGTLATLFSALGTLPNDVFPWPSQVFAGLATILLGYIGFANPLKQFNRTNGAYKILDSAIRKYDVDQDVVKLNEKIDESEHVANPSD